MNRKLRIAIVGFLPFQNYRDALEALGAETEVLNKPFSPDGWDGLLLPGGEDVDPARYGWENCGSVGIDRDEDALQTDALQAFLRAGKPVLGICRGCQLLNVAFGGTLVQDLPTRIRHTKSSDEEPTRTHEIEAAEGSFLYDLYGRRFTVNSSHHQAVALPGKGLEICAVSPADGVPEAVCHRELPVWGVQFHPERMTTESTVQGNGVLNYFLEKCR